MFGLDQSPRYACRSTSPPPPAPLPRSGFVQRPNFGHSATVTHSGSFWAGSGLSALEFTFGKIDIRGAISRCEALL